MGTTMRCTPPRRRPDSRIDSSGAATSSGPCVSGGLRACLTIIGMPRSRSEGHHHSNPNGHRPTTIASQAIVVAVRLGDRTCRFDDGGQERPSLVDKPRKVARNSGGDRLFRCTGSRHAPCTEICHQKGPRSQYKGRRTECPERQRGSARSAAIRCTQPTPISDIDPKKRPRRSPDVRPPS